MAEPEEDQPLTASDLKVSLAELDEKLQQLRQHPDDWQTQRSVGSAIRRLAEITLPTGAGSGIDKKLVKPKAAAILLMRSLHRAHKNVPTPPTDLNDLVRCIDRLLAAIPVARAETEWVAHSATARRLAN
jgi:hypothetical protein